MATATTERTDTAETVTYPPQTGIFKHISKAIPYFRNPRHVLILKLDCLLLTWTFIAGIMKEMDQSATTQAYVSGMREALSLYGNELVFFNTYFSIGYAIGLVPGQLAQTRVRPSLFLPTCEIIWGLFVIVTCKAQNATTVYALRFFLGLFSAVFWPSVVSLIFNWYTPKELAFRIACFNVSDVAGAMFLGALQAALYRNLNGAHGIAGWQWLFIVSGVITIAQGIVGFFIIPDTPAYTRAKWLTEDEKKLSRERMEGFGANTSKLIPPAVLRQKLRKLIVHPVTYFFLVAFALNAWAHRATSYFVLYIESLKDAAGNRMYSTYQVNVLPLGGYALQIVSNLILNGLSDWKHWRWQISTGSTFSFGVLLCVLCAWPSDQKVVMAFYFMTYAANAGAPSLMAWFAELMRKEPEARAIVVAITVMIVYIGHATIPLRAFRVADAPQYPIGFPLATAMSFASVFVQLGLLWWARRNPQLVKAGYEGTTVDSRVSDEESSGSVGDGASERDGEHGEKTADPVVSKVNQ
ncbi:major facilitator superfamily domain-containing protein [Fusarium sp. MPI-SDFR-AT-0072]|uniref:Pantothenate transporter liz1 n=1 Tax=Fusarium oxysporum f. sp. rapae TaxID=485398 RepID=A0A8J5P7T4_FUSOX|nr:Pantothenate transporter liz1 [Fusarium oxysporum f. sp. rapae]KAH7171727.1 major facilitator superfamily domain-containing protein [Fusarium sp. MPI-SDFR-AT-0072]